MALRTVVYAHCSSKHPKRVALDLWEPYFVRAKRHHPQSPQVLLAERGVDTSFPYLEGVELIEYDESLEYRERILQCLEQLEDDYVIFNHEDFFLYDDVWVQQLEVYLEYLKSNDDFSFVRLIRSGADKNCPVDNENMIGLSRLPQNSNSLFSLQPTIWNVDRFHSVVESISPNMSMWDFERSGSSVARRLGINGLYSFHGEPKRGGAHWDSVAYPYIATAVVKGEWNTSEYPKEMKKVFEEFNIDPQERGER